MSLYTEIIYDNGETLSIPRIVSAGAGWVLRPDEARTKAEIKSDKNKSFGRSYEGNQAARTWLKAYITKWQQKYDWPKPIATKAAFYGPNLYRLGLGAYFVRNEIDAVTFGLKAVEADERFGRTDKVIYVAQVPAVYEWHLRQEVGEKQTTNPYEWVDLQRTEIACNDRDDLLNKVENFAKQPLVSIGKYLNDALPIADEIEWPEPFPWPNESSETWVDPAQTIKAYSDDNHTFYRDRHFVEKVIASEGAAEAFELLNRAFAHLNVSFRAGYEWDYSNRDEDGNYKKTLKNVSITVPGNKEDPHNKEGHEIQLTHRSVTVTCGYHLDDERYAEYQKRQAANWLTEMMEETDQTPTYEDYDYTPNN